MLLKNILQFANVKIVLRAFFNVCLLKCGNVALINVFIKSFNVTLISTGYQNIFQVLNCKCITFYFIIPAFFLLYRSNYFLHNCVLFLSTSLFSCYIINLFFIQYSSLNLLKAGTHFFKLNFFLFCKIILTMKVFGPQRINHIRYDLCQRSILYCKACKVLQAYRAR